MNLQFGQCLAGMTTLCSKQCQVRQLKRELRMARSHGWLGGADLGWGPSQRYGSGSLIPLHGCVGFLTAWWLCPKSERFKRIRRTCIAFLWTSLGPRTAQGSCRCPPRFKEEVAQTRAVGWQALEKHAVLDIVVPHLATSSPPSLHPPRKAFLLNYLSPLNRLNHVRPTESQARSLIRH